MARYDGSWEILRQPPRTHVQPHIEGLEPTTSESLASAETALETAENALFEAQTAYNAASVARLIAQLNVWIHEVKE